MDVGTISATKLIESKDLTEEAGPIGVLDLERVSR
jgi:hypothetical protein